MDDESVSRPGWDGLRALTAARVALGRAGAGLPTDAHLAFQLAHARARDAVFSTLDVAGLTTDLRMLFPNDEPLLLHSAAATRAEYLQRPDLGRRLSDASRGVLATSATRDGANVAFVIADGLSSTAVNRHALGVLDAVIPRLHEAGDWQIAPVALVEQGRVALGDDVARTMRAEMIVVLIGERPGLSAPDSMGIYLTYRPVAHTTDAGRNCLSNIRQGGMSYVDAAGKLFYLMTEARRRGLSGVDLKDEAEEKAPLLPIPEAERPRQVL